MRNGWQNGNRVILDRWRRIQPLNAKRIRNAWALHKGFRAMQRGIAVPQKAWPMSLSVEPTTSCNLRCPECPSGLRSFTRPTGMLQTELLAELMKEAGPRLAYLNLYFQGEPYLHKGMDELVRLGRAHGVYTSTSTNAHFLRPERCEAIVESGLNRLIISIDGTTQETYQSYRIGGQLDKVLEGTENMLHARRKSKSGLPHIVWQFLVVGPNEHQLGEIQSMAKEIGVDELVVKTAQIDAPADDHPLLTKDSELRRYDREKDGTWSIRNAFRDECWRMWQGCVMTWDGRIVPCCFDKDAEHTMGTFGEKTFESIWFSEQYDAFRAQIFHARSSIEMCQNCSEGSHVYA